MKVFQIYFKDEQKEKLDYTPYYNDDCTPFFENSVVRKLIEGGQHLGSDYFGVVSHKLREKIHITKHSWKDMANISNKSNQQFTPELFKTELYKLKPDAMSFQRHMPHDPISFADKFHPNFSKYFKEIMAKIGFNWAPSHFNNVFYCNFFVAKSEVYEEYVKEMLAPAMDVMLEMPELFNDSKYPYPLPDDLKKKFNCEKYPYHPFIGERMFSYFAHINNLNCTHF
jgi:hypothetical protein